jgi:D-alanyl-D-alanine carboxypeptidase
VFFHNSKAVSLDLALTTPETQPYVRGMITTDVQHVLDRAVAAGLPGVLAEVHDGDRRWFGTAGVADTASGGARQADHRFRIGSITKTFVATVVLQLVAEGKVGLDDTVDLGEITVRHLLANTSGLFNYLDDLEAVNQREYPTPEQLVQIATAHPPAFAPGTDWAYCNTNYVLAGMLVERLTGTPLREEIARRVTRPLGLIGTYLPEATDLTIQGPHSRHYTDFAGGRHDITELNTTPFWAAGGMISTAGDLNRFFGALLAGELVSTDVMFATIPTKNWIPDTAYGLGISSLTLPCGQEVWGMGGAIFGSWSVTYGVRGHVITANVNGDWGDPLGALIDVVDAEFRTTG